THAAHDLPHRAELAQLAGDVPLDLLELALLGLGVEGQRAGVVVAAVHLRQLPATGGQEGLADGFVPLHRVEDADGRLRLDQAIRQGAYGLLIGIQWHASSLLDALQARHFDEDVGVGRIVKVIEDPLQWRVHQHTFALGRGHRLAVQATVLDLVEQALDVQVEQHQLAVPGQLEAEDGEVAAQASGQAGRQIPAAPMAGHGETVFLGAVQIVRAALGAHGPVLMIAHATDTQEQFVPPAVLTLPGAEQRNGSRLAGRQRLAEGHQAALQHQQQRQQCQRTPGTHVSLLVESTRSKRVACRYPPPHPSLASRRYKKPPEGGFLQDQFCGRMCGNRITSRMDGELVSSITRRSMPMPSPAVGGMPYSRARTKSASKCMASSSPASFSATWAWKRSAWPSASLSSE